ncbi:MAG: Fe-S cluster protein [Peptococcaceae bacterium BICA1-7]|nr:MAG: Fe-S cluster protein [Peptococcaceae bacterium BICA1-7]HBV96099.1 Fe-S cluster protein [Desulfotomaculum sp.]
MFLEEIYITHTEQCIAERDKIRLKAELTSDVTEVMPYLNTVIKNAIFNRYAPLLSFTREFRLMVLYPQSLTMAKAVDRADARQILEWLKDLINDTWENRSSITPNFEKKIKPSVPQFYSWLPRTNCRQCGEASCLAFAALLLTGRQSIENCRPLFTPEYVKEREALTGVLNAIL